MANFCEVVAQRLAWDQAPRWGKKAKKGVKQQKIKIILKKKQRAKQTERWTGEGKGLQLGSLFIFVLFPPNAPNGPSLVSGQ